MVQGIAGTADNRNTPIFGLREKDFFLRLLMTQIKNQNPLEPMSVHEMTAQMAQFTTIEKMISLESIFSRNFMMSQFNSATGIIGREAKGFNPYDGQEIQGIVESVSFREDGIVVRIDGMDIPFNSITEVM